MKPNRCSVQDCTRVNSPWYARGFCDRHYQVWKRNGVPETDLTRKRGQGFVNADGYKMLWIRGRHMREHRWVMEQFLGRRLKRSEHLHHINGNKLDNRVENLRIVTNAQHGQLHTKEYPDGVKSCSRCGETKTLTGFPFRLNSRRRTIRQRFYDSWCKTCNYAAKQKRRHEKQRLGLPYT